jgi:hypothetical protein
MKLLNFTLALLGIAPIISGSILSRSMLPDCTADIDGETACSSRTSYGNDVMRCKNLRWEWVELCDMPEYQCFAGACVLPPPDCVDGEKMCDGIWRFQCIAGIWDAVPCRCIAEPEPHCIGDE